MYNIRSFNENVEVDSKVEEIKEFCGWNLATLLDEGYDLVFKQDRILGSINFSYLRVFLTKRNDGEMFGWDDVKDYFIPFFITLMENYELFKYGMILVLMKKVVRLQ